MFHGVNNLKIITLKVSYMGSKIGLTGATVTAFLKTADLLNQSSKEVKKKKSEIQKNVMYYYYKASKKI